MAATENMMGTESVETMDAEKRKRLEKAGFRIGTVAEFLGLTPEQSELVEIKVNLSAAVRQQRDIGSLSQSELAEKIGSSQSRVAKMEAGDASVSLDLLIKALIAQGMTRGELAKVISGQEISSPSAAAPAARTASRDVVRRNVSKKRVQKPQTAGI